MYDLLDSRKISVQLDRMARSFGKERILYGPVMRVNNTRITTLTCNQLPIVAYSNRLLYYKRALIKA